MTSYPWGNQRRFFAAADYYRQRFGTRLQKLTLNAGFTCPNRDGTVSTGGCTFCSNESFSPSYCNPEKSVTQQLQEGKGFHEKRYKSAGAYLAYFQAYSNTYGAAHHLEKLYREALAMPGVRGIIIGTRPDCINEAILELLSELSKETYIVVEFGIESIYNETLKRINRGHSWEDTQQAIRECNKRGIFCGGHLIFGLPGESREKILASASEISKLGLHTIKLHQLHIVKNTAMADEYIAFPERFTLFELPDYIPFVVSYIEQLNPSIIIDRMAGETQPWNNLGVQWDLRYDQVLLQIERYMNEKNTWQGKYYQ